MVALAIVLAVLALLAFLRVGVRASYSEEGFALRAKVGPVWIGILPKKAGGGKKPKKPRKKKKKKEPEKEEKKGGPVETIRRFLPPVTDTLGRLRRKLRVDSLTVRYLSASDDPFDAAVNYGRASAAMAALSPALDNFFNIRRRDIRADACMEGGGDKIFADIRLTIAVWEIVYVGCGMLPVLKKQKSAAQEPSGPAGEKETGGRNEKRA